MKLIYFSNCAYLSQSYHYPQVKPINILYFLKAINEKYIKSAKNLQFRVAVKVFRVRVNNTHIGKQNLKTRKCAVSSNIPLFPICLLRVVNFLVTQETHTHLS